MDLSLQEDVNVLLSHTQTKQSHELNSFGIAAKPEDNKYQLGHIVVHRPRGRIHLLFAISRLP